MNYIILQKKISIKGRDYNFDLNKIDKFFFILQLIFFMIHYIFHAFQYIYMKISENDINILDMSENF